MRKKFAGGLLVRPIFRNWGFIPAFRQVESGELMAVASRDGTKAKTFAEKHGIPQAFDSYAEMLESDAIDAVYNPLPNSMHAEWTVVAAKNDKHVFCEKPLAVNAGEVEQMVAACKEAYITLDNPCHPAEESSFTLHKGDEEEPFSFETGTKPFAPAIEHFNDCILEGKELMAEAGRASGTLNIIHAALESSRTGQRVEL